MKNKPVELPNSAGQAPDETTPLPAKPSLEPRLSQEEKSGAEHARYVETPVENSQGCYPLNTQKP